MDIMSRKPYTKNTQQQQQQQQQQIKPLHFNLQMLTFSSLILKLKI